MGRKPNGNGQGVFTSLYQNLACRPQDELVEIFRKLIGPQKLYLMMEGTRISLHFGGQKIFDVSTILAEAGIPLDDPRGKVYRSIRGGVEPKEAVAKLRSISSKEETVCRNAGAVPITNGGESKRIWWIPIACTQKFKTEIEALIAEYHKVRDEELIAPYSAIRQEKEQVWMQAAEAAWDNLQALGCTTGDKQTHLQGAQALFDSRFPSPKAIAQKVVAYSEAMQEELPAEVETVFRDLREAEIEREQAEARATQVQTQMQEVELQERQKRLEMLEEESEARNRMLREAVARDTKQAKEVILRLQLQLSEVAMEIVNATKSGLPISAATRKSWRQRIEQLDALSPDNPTWQDALRSLSSVSEQTGRKDEAPGDDEVARAQRLVENSINYLRRNAGLAVVSESLWAMVERGQGEAALREIKMIKKRHESGLDEINALEEMLINRVEA